MRWMAAVAIAAMASCGDNTASPDDPDDDPTLPDGGTAVVPPGCPPLPGYDGFDFFGETCVSVPGSVTICRAGLEIDRTGLCVGDVCRPWWSRNVPGISGGCPACPAGTAHLSPEGGGYCAP